MRSSDERTGAMRRPYERPRRAQSLAEAEVEDFARNAPQLDFRRALRKGMFDAWLTEAARAAAGAKTRRTPE